MNYEQAYNDARIDLIDYLNIDTPELADKHNKMDLKALLEILLDRHESIMVMHHITDIAYESGLPYEKLETYLEKAQDLFKDISSQEDIDDEVFIKLAKQLS